MKKLYTTLVALLAIVQVSYAQWTISGTKIYNSNTGNVGVGTNAPSTLLSIGREFGTGTIDIQRYLNLTNGASTSPANGNGVGMSFSIGNNLNASQTLGAIDVVNEYFNTASNMRFYTVTGSTLTEQMRLDGRGYLGIGTINPANKLDVQGNGSFYTSGSTTALQIGSVNTGKTSIDIATSSDAGGYGIIQSVSVGGSVYGNTAINPNGGFVGIGTPTPKEALSVNGNIRSKQVKVETANWPDYVFKKEYNLPSLSDVKTFIDKNHHLPEMPSEADVIKEGVNLGEMIKLQTKKIEELTLYLIDKDTKLQSQQKEIEDQNKELKDQSKAIQSLQQQIDQLSKKLNN